MSKLTDGPWFRDQYGNVYGWTPTENGKASVLLIDNRHSDATSADKNLISAALDMLEALQAVQAFINGEPDAVEPFGIVRAVIAKATGGEV